MTEGQVIICNIGDARAIISTDNGQTTKTVSMDHVPSNPAEMRRIILNGGQTYQHNETLSIDDTGKQIKAPVRVLPGRLQSSRSIGDCLAKLE